MFLGSIILVISLTFNFCWSWYFHCSTVLFVSIKLSLAANLSWTREKWPGYLREKVLFVTINIIVQYISIYYLRTVEGLNHLMCGALGQISHENVIIEPDWVFLMKPAEEEVVDRKQLNVIRRQNLCLLITVSVKFATLDFFSLKVSTSYLDIVDIT